MFNPFPPLLLKNIYHSPVSLWPEWDRQRFAKFCFSWFCPSVCVALKNPTAPSLPEFSGLVLKGHMGWKHSHWFAPKQKQKLGCFGQMWSQRFGWAPGPFVLEFSEVLAWPWCKRIFIVQKILTKNYNFNLRSWRSKRQEKRVTT